MGRAHAVWRETQRVALTLAISAFGGFIASLLHLPAAWLMGGALAVAIAAISGVRVGLPAWATEITFISTGLSMGATVARDSFSLMGQWPVTIGALALEVVLIVLITGAVLRRVFRLDRGTAYLSSLPGQLNMVLSMAAAGVGNPRQIVIIQVMRLMALTICVPVGALFLPVGHYALPVDTALISPLTLIIVWVLCAATGFVFARLRVPAGYALGAMALATAAKLLGGFDGQMPPTLLVIIFIAVGGVIGSRFVGLTRGELKAAAASGLVGTAVTLAVVTAVSFTASLFVQAPLGQIWLGLAPGALESMGALGIALGFDTAFIAAHHVVRILVLSFAIPGVALLVREPSSARQNAE
jgi:membrane AbrB-like protein